MPHSRNALRTGLARPNLLLLPLLLLLAFLAVGAAGCGPDPAEDLPIKTATERPAGQGATREAMALALDNKDRCLKVAKGGVQRFEQRALAAASGEAEYASFNDYVKTDAADDLAVAKAVSKLIEGLLSKAKAESSPEIATALTELYRAQLKLCSDAGYDWHYAENYQSKISESVFAFSKADQKLAGLVELTPEQYQAVLAKHASAFTAAAKSVEQDKSLRMTAEQWQLGTVAEQERISAAEKEREIREWQELKRRLAEAEAAHQQAIDEWRRARAERQAEPIAKLGRAKPGPMTPKEAERASRAQAMKAWNNLYWRRAAPVKNALSRYLLARGQDAERVLAACQVLRTAATNLLAEPECFSSPEPGVNQALQQAFTEFQSAGHACMEGQEEEAARRIRTGERSLAAAASLLRPYNLQP